MSKLNLGLNECSNQVYHADRTFLSSSVLKTILKDLGQYHKEYILGVPREPFRNVGVLEEGSLAHSMILEPHLTESEFAFYPGAMKSGGVFEQFKVDNPGKTIIGRAQKFRVEELVEAYKKHPDAVYQIEGGIPEQTLCVELSGVPIKTRFDMIHPDRGIIVDIKTTGYAGDQETFKNTVEGLYYNLSGALYCMAAEQYYGRPFTFMFVVLSKQTKTCDVYKLSEASRLKGEQMIFEAIRKFKKAKETGDWTEKNLMETLERDVANYEILEV